ncbi:MAG: zf-TFIIB domain-containing protein [Arenicella sp.]
MNCPSCQSNLLKPTQLQPGLPALTCINCHGYSVNLLTYRHWIEQQPKIERTPTSTVTVDDSSKALICNKCSKIMHKYNISIDHDNKVDLCTTCDEVWLDQGEWQLLLELELHDKLTDIITTPWQSDMREQEALKRYKEKHVELLGEEDFARLEAFKTWLQEHPKEFEIMNYLRN